MIALLGLLTGCLSQAQLAQRDAQSRAENSALQASFKNTTVRCETKTLCDKAFSLTKIFIERYADMRIQMSDDTLVSTYGPISYGKVAMKATKTPGVGESAAITLAVVCKGLDITGPQDMISSMCKQRVAAINDAFKPYVEASLMK